MDCRNCGAPVRVEDGSDHGRCDFCDSYFFPTPLTESADRIAPVGRPGDRDCPRCCERMMAGLIDGIGIEYCQRCRGFLVETDAFSHVVRQRRAEYTGPEQMPGPLIRDELQRRIACPGCQGTMEVHPYYGPGNAVIDSCIRCHLVWMDHGELSSIETAPGRR